MYRGVRYRHRGAPGSEILIFCHLALITIKKSSKKRILSTRACLLFLPPPTQITNGFSVRDVEMDSWSCLEGWPAQGLGSGGSGGEGEPGGGDVLAVCRSNEEDVMAVRNTVVAVNCCCCCYCVGSGGYRMDNVYHHPCISEVPGFSLLMSKRSGLLSSTTNSTGLASERFLLCLHAKHLHYLWQTGDEDSCVSLVRNPAPVGAKARANWGHTSASGVSGLAFLYDDRRLISVGGTCVFVWRSVLALSQTKGIIVYVCTSGKSDSQQPRSFHLSKQTDDV